MTPTQIVSVLQNHEQAIQELARVNGLTAMFLEYISSQVLKIDMNEFQNWANNYIQTLEANEQADIQAVLNTLSVPDLNQDE